MIPETLYVEIIENLPIVCVDGFIVQEGKILLVKRTQEPAKDEWWVPGGRLLKNETLESGILRKIKDEVGLSLVRIAQIGVAETIFENKHTINICFLINVSNTNVLLNNEHSEFYWFELNNLPKIHPELQRMIDIIKKGIKS